MFDSSMFDGKLKEKRFGLKLVFFIGINLGLVVAWLSALSYMERDVLEADDINYYFWIVKDLWENGFDLATFFQSRGSTIHISNKVFDYLNLYF